MFFTRRELLDGDRVVVLPEAPEECGRCNQLAVPRKKVGWQFGVTGSTSSAQVNSLMVKAAAHDVDIGKLTDDSHKMERKRTEDAVRHKQDMDAVYEELDQKVYEKNFLAQEDHLAKLARGVVKLSQVRARPRCCRSDEPEGRGLLGGSPEARAAVCERWLGLKVVVFQFQQLQHPNTRAS